MKEHYTIEFDSFKTTRKR